ASRRGRKRSAITLFDVRRLLPEARWFLNKAWRRLNVRVRGSLVYGFPDPFATGLAHALFIALPQGSSVWLQPDFSQGRLDGWAEFRLRIYPILFLVLFAQAAFRPAVRKLWWPGLRNKIVPKK